jgi:hypothetical protein
MSYPDSPEGNCRDYSHVRTSSCRSVRDYCRCSRAMTWSKIYGWNFSRAAISTYYSRKRHWTMWCLELTIQSS